MPLTASLPSHPKTARILQPTIQSFPLWVRLSVYWPIYKGLSGMFFKLPTLTTKEALLANDAIFASKEELITFALGLWLVDGLLPCVRWTWWVWSFVLQRLPAPPDTTWAVGEVGIQVWIETTVLPNGTLGEGNLGPLRVISPIANAVPGAYQPSKRPLLSGPSTLLWRASAPLQIFFSDSLPDHRLCFMTDMATEFFQKSPA